MIGGGIGSGALSPSRMHPGWLEGAGEVRGAAWLVVKYLAGQPSTATPVWFALRMGVLL